MAKDSTNNYYLDLFDVTSAFGENRGTYTHMGVDLSTAGAAGKSILSVFDGVIVKNEYSAARGNYITVKGSDGTLATFEHMQSKSPFAVGSSVKLGQELGKIGTSGDSSGPHLHLEMQDASGKFFDPIAWLKGKIIPSSSSSSSSGSSSGGMIQETANGLVERFQAFSWNLIPFVLGVIFLILALLAMFAKSKANLIKKVTK